MRKPFREKTSASRHAPAIEGGAIGDFLRRIVVGDGTGTLRKEDLKKVRELSGLLPEIERALTHVPAPQIVDAAAGRGWVALATLALVEPRLDRKLHVTAIERDARRVELTRDAGQRASLDGLTVVAADLAERDAWPARADLVVALHACGDASDRAIEGAIAVRATHVLVAPCCVAHDLPDARRGLEALATLGLPSRGEIRRRFVEAFVMGMRTLALEAGGYHTDIVAFVPETVTPHNLVLRARLVDEPVRRARAGADLARLRGSAG